MAIAMEETVEPMQFTQVFKVTPEMIDDNHHFNNVWSVKWIQDIDWKSKAPDVVISDFEGKFGKDNWEPSFGPKSKAEIEMPYKTSKLDGNSLYIKHFEMSDWVDFVLDFTKNGAAHDAKQRDWTNHWGIMFDVYSERAWQ